MNHPRFWCSECSEDAFTSLATFFDHQRIMHGNSIGEDDIEKWPDGGIVIHDHALRPAMFEGDAL